MQNVAWHRFAEISRYISEKVIARVAAYVAAKPECTVPFSITGAFTDVQVTHAMGTNTPPYHHRCWPSNFADNILDSPFPSWPGGHNVHDFQKQFEMWTCQTTAHFSTSSQSISDEFGPREAGGIFNCTSCFQLTCGTFQTGVF
ncbi:hypothetical protein XENORESO_005978 [Xenotaenia resolanae]|uniref:Uncharacterized protein n=1 Tax=Xenotaenia resolanae TaxID=208358 RepID=A0ABV0X6X9_9TELE